VNPEFIEGPSLQDYASITNEGDSLRQDTHERGACRGAGFDEVQPEMNVEDS